MPKLERVSEIKEATKLTDSITKKLFKGFLASEENPIPQQEAYENIKDLSDLHSILQRIIIRRNTFYALSK